MILFGEEAVGFAQLHPQVQLFFDKDGPQRPMSPAEARDLLPEQLGLLSCEALSESTEIRTKIPNKETP